MFIDSVETKSLAGSYILDYSQELLSAKFSAPASLREEEPGDDSVDLLVPSNGLKTVRTFACKEKSRAIQQIKIKMMGSEFETDVSGMQELEKDAGREGEGRRSYKCNCHVPEHQ